MRLIEKLKSKLPTTRRGKIILKVIVAFAVVFVVANTGILVWSGHPSFCRNCHNIEPHYKSWADSVHAKEGVDCLDCHVRPGAYHYARRKVESLSEVASYITGGYPDRMRADIHDSSCLRSGCHSKAELARKPSEFGKVKFPHDKHAGTLRGRELRCTSCHAMTMHSKGDKVPTHVCYSCHFMPAYHGETDEEILSREKQRECETCHEIPDEVEIEKGLKLDHKKYAYDDTCVRCHGQPSRDDGAVPGSRCFSCHSRDLGYMDRADDADYMHAQHGGKAQFDCLECHDEIHHEPRDISGAGRFVGAARCKECHTEEYRAWVNSDHADAWDNLAEPDRQKPRCVICHVTGIGRPGGFIDVRKTARLTGVQCESCHGPGEAHVKAAKAEKKESVLKKTIIVKPMNTCARCHIPHKKHEDFAE